MRFLNDPRYVSLDREYAMRKGVGARAGNVSFEDTDVVDQLLELRNHTLLQARTNCNILPGEKFFVDDGK